jgi:hypothetical protein
MSSCEAFEAWWRLNHPHDWFAAQNNDIPISNAARLRVRELTEAAYRAGQEAMRERAGVRAEMLGREDIAENIRSMPIEA